MNKKLVESITGMIGAIGMSAVFYLKLQSMYSIMIMFFMVAFILWLHQYYISLLLTRHPETAEETARYKKSTKYMHIAMYTIFCSWLAFLIIKSFFLKS